MITRGDVERIREWAVSRGGRVTFVFRGYRYRLVIGRFIHAEDEEGRTVEWGRAFGAQLPHQVLSSLAVERVVVRSAEGERVLRSLRELMELVQ